jgi:transcriptional regulator with XRE-family HTH domain
MARPKKPQPVPVADSTDRAVGARVRFVRLLNDLSLVEFGAKLGLSESGMSRIESGERRLDPVAHASEIYRLYGWDHTWLYTGMVGNLSETNRNLLDRGLSSSSMETPSRPSRSRSRRPA